MTYEEKVRWLRRYQESLQIEKELEQEIEQLRTRACRATRCLTGLPGGGDGQAIPRSVEKILREKEKLENRIIKSEMIRKEVIATIEKKQNENQIEGLILYKRYILGKTFDLIADEMDCSLRWCFAVHKKSVSSLEING